MLCCVVLFTDSMWSSAFPFICELLNLELILLCLEIVACFLFAMVLNFNILIYAIESDPLEDACTGTTFD